MQKLIAVLAKTLNVGESEVSSALLDGDKLKDEGPKWIEDKYAARYASVKEEEKQKYEEAKKNITDKVTKETAAKIQDPLRAKYGLSPDKIGDDLLAELYAKVESFKTATTEPDKIRTSNTYLEDIQKLKTQLEAEKEEFAKPFKTELEQLKESLSTKELQTAVLAKAKEYLNTLAVRDDLPKETTEAILKTYESSVLNGAKFKILENGEIIVLDDKGEMKKDHLGADVKLDTIFKNAAAIIPLKAGGDKGSGGAGGAGGNGGGGGGKYAGPLPTDMAHAQKILQELRLAGKSKEDIDAASVAMQEHLTKPAQ